MSSTPLSGTILFQDDFSTNGRLNSANWDFNHWTPQNNPSYLGLTQMRQELPFAQGGMARIRLDTWLDGRAFSGSEAITNQSWDLTGGGVAFEGKFRFDSTQGGMITGFFAFQDFPEGAVRAPHDEIDFEILTTQLAKISTNVFTIENGQQFSEPHSIPITGSFADWHTYRMEWLPTMVRWFVDGQLIRTDTEHVPTNPQQLHMNLWGVPGDWKINPGDPDGPNVGDPSFVPAQNAGQNQTFFFDVSSVKIERLSTISGDASANTLLGTSSHDGIDGGAGDDALDGGAGDDTIFGGAGNDVIDGGTGSDTAVFTGDRARYAIASTNAGIVVSDQLSGPGNQTDGTDTLRGIEFLNFADGLYALNDDGTLSLVPLGPLIGSSNEGDLVTFNDAYVTTEGKAIVAGPGTSVLWNDTAASAMHGSLVSGPARGVLQFADDGSFSYTPDAGFVGIDSFVYRNIDAAGATGEATVFINVAPTNDGSGTLDVLGLSINEQLAAAYVGFLGRGADLDGFFYWGQRAASVEAQQGDAAALRYIADSFAGSAEAKTNFALLANPNGASDIQIKAFVSEVYDNLFARDVDASGLNYWTAEVKHALNTGGSLGGVVTNIIGGAQNSASGQDITALLNKVMVTFEYLNEQSDFNTQWSSAQRDGAIELIADVGADPLTVLAGIKAADELAFQGA